MALSAMDLTSKSKILHQMQVKAVQLEAKKGQDYGVNTDWQKTNVSDQMLDRMQESANKRDRNVKAQEKQRIREETGYQSPTEDEDKSEPMKLDELTLAHKQYSDATGDYQQINIGRYNFANSEKDEKHEPSIISINDQL